MTKYSKFQDLDLQNSIDFSYNLDNGKTGKMIISKPLENMQEDAACFEGWALLMKCICQYEKIIISFKESSIDWDGHFENITKDKYHYMRFLFRLWKFKESMGWLDIEDKNLKCHMEKFISNINSVTTKANYPKTESKTSNDYNRVEHQIEQFLIKDNGKTLNDLLSKSSSEFRIKTPYNQLPNGLFIDTVQEKTRIFPTGFYDIWAIDETGTKLCIFELKAKSNKKVGIISELFFYAEYAKLVLLDKNKNGKERFQTIDLDDTYRGYDELQRALISNKLNGIQAVFLVEELHPRLEENIECILKELNKSKQVHYSVVYYDSCRLQIQQ